MIAYPPPLLAVGGARTGIAPANLLDVQDVNGNIYLWSDRRIIAPSVIWGAQPAPVAIASTATPTHTGSGTASVTTTGCTLNINAPYAYPNVGDDGTAQAQWSNFALPALPPGAAVTGVRLQITMSGNLGDVAFSGTTPGLALPGGTFSGVYTGTNIYPGYGDPAAFVATVLVNLELAYSLHGYGGTFSDTLTVTSVELLIDFTAPDNGSAVYEPWILTVPQLTFHRSSVTDVGNFVLQNLSGDTVSRDFEKIMRKSALEGAFFVYRSWQPDAQGSWIEVHGTLTVDDVGVDTVTLKGEPAINPAQDDTPAMEYSETCQWRWSSPQCGATGSTECQYSYQTCQVPERILVVLNDFEKNFGETTANIRTQVLNRQRRF